MHQSSVNGIAITHNFLRIYCSDVEMRYVCNISNKGRRRVVGHPLPTV